LAWKITDWEQIEPPKRSDRHPTGAIKWWKCPTSQNRRYKQLLADRRGMEVVAAWYAIVASWGRQSKESRDEGILRSPGAGARPATLQELAVDTMIPAKKLEYAIHKLLSVGWLSTVDAIGTTGDIPEGRQWSSETRQDKKRKEKKRREENPTPKINFRDHVTLTQIQNDKLFTKLGQAKLDACYDKLENYKASNGKKYVSDYHAILNWVIGQVEKDQGSVPKSNDEIWDEIEKKEGQV